MELKILLLLIVGFMVLMILLHLHDREHEEKTKLKYERIILDKEDKIISLKIEIRKYNSLLRDCQKEKEDILYSLLDR
jgi:hypothetical protein